MSYNTPQSAALLKLEEVLNLPLDNLEGKAVRVTGRSDTLKLSCVNLSAIHIVRHSIFGERTSPPGQLPPDNNNPDNNPPDNNNPELGQFPLPIYRVVQKKPHNDKLIVL